MEGLVLVLLIFLGLVIGLILWIIFVPFYLKIDTDHDLYTVSQFGTFLLIFTPVQEPHFSVKVFGISVSEQGKSVKKEPGKKKRKPFIKRSIQSWIYLIRGLLKSFRIKKLVGTIDLDDMVLHSQIYAIYPIINQGAVQLTTNLNNIYSLDMIIEGRLNKMLYTFITFLTKK